MNYIDAIYVLVLCGFVSYGFKVGIVKGGAAIVSLVIGLIFATRTMHSLGDTFTKVWGVHAVVGAVLAFVIVFFGIILLQIVLIGLLWRPSRASGIMSRLGGALFGAVEGALYISLILILLSLYNKPSKGARDHSVLYKSMRGFAPRVFDSANRVFLGSTTFDDELRKTFEKFKVLPLD